jgi:hypothetical protein
MKRAAALTPLILLLGNHPVEMEVAHTPPWNQTGHALTALVAYQRLDHATRNRIVQILRQHERFEADFVDGGHKQLFTQAALWPDIVKNYSGELQLRFDRRSWHYINLPLSLDGEESELGPGEEALRRRWDPESSARNLNIMQALDMCAMLLDSSRVSDAHKAKYLCWLFHLVGDLHQPCHSTALFDGDVFPTGDAGGTRITTSRGSLHGRWDGALGDGTLLSSLEEQIRNVESDNPDADVALASMRFEDWLQESHDLAGTTVYDASIRQQLGAGNTQNVSLSWPYVENMRAAAARRALFAGRRLAALLESLRL